VIAYLRSGTFDQIVCYPHPYFSLTTSVIVQLEKPDMVDAYIAMEGLLWQALSRSGSIS